MRAPVLAYIGLGANLGEPVAALNAALDSLAELPHCALVRHSAFYRSAPVDSSGPDYVNAVAELTTALTAPALLRALQQIELDAGRERPYRNAPRTLDLDLLLYGSAIVQYGVAGSILDVQAKPAANMSRPPATTSFVPKRTAAREPAIDSAAVETANGSSRIPAENGS